MTKEIILKDDIDNIACQGFLDYSISVIQGRALPNVEDGLKPIHRRVLYSYHHDLNIKPNGKTVKSAKVVGSCLSSYHPHGI